MKCWGYIITHTDPPNLGGHTTWPVLHYTNQIFSETLWHTDQWPLTHHPHGPTNPNQNPPRRPDHFFTLWSSSQYKPYIFWKLTIHWPNDHRLLAVWAHPTWDSLTFGVSRVTTSSFFQSFFLQLCPYFCLLIQGPQCFSTLGVRFSQPYVTVAGPAPLWDLSQLPTSPDRY